MEASRNMAEMLETNQIFRLRMLCTECLLMMKAGVIEAGAAEVDRWNEEEKRDEEIHRHREVLM